MVSVKRKQDIYLEFIKGAGRKKAFYNNFKL